jgi:hypothetical protein
LPHRVQLAQLPDSNSASAPSLPEKLAFADLTSMDRLAAGRQVNREAGKAFLTRQPPRL